MKKLLACLIFVIILCSFLSTYPIIATAHLAQTPQPTSTPGPDYPGSDNHTQPVIVYSVYSPVVWLGEIVPAPCSSFPMICIVPPHH